MNKNAILLTVIMPIFIFAQYTDDWIHLNFDESMELSRFPDALRVTKRIVGIEGADLMGHYRMLYDLYNPTKLQPTAEPKIPKIIHQIWLGSPLPDEFKEFMQSWIEYHLNGWHYKLWTDEDVKTFGLTNQQYYDATDNYGVKSDLLKWEIVYRYGGVYIDVDFECLRSLDLFHHLYDFYTGIQPLDTQFVQLGAALFGAVPNHPILKHCIETIKDDWHKKGAPTKSGPVHFTKSFYVMAGKNDSKDIALPASYFYPLGCRQTQLKRDVWQSRGAFAVHHWAKSWMPASYRLPQFQGINNAESSKSWND